MRLPLAITVLLASSVSWAKDPVVPDASSTMVQAVDVSSPVRIEPANEVVSAAARRPDLIGHHCSYSTASLIERVLTKGEPWLFDGRLTESVPVDANVAVAWAAGDARVLANGVADQLAPNLSARPAIRAQGQQLMHQGVRYVVLRSVTARPSNP